MSSTRRAFEALKITVIASSNMAVTYMGVKQFRHNQERFNQLPAEVKAKFMADPKNNIGNSGDAMAVFNSRM